MSKSELVASFFMVQAWTPVLELGWNYPSWSISAEWFAYLAFPFVVYAVARLARRGLWTVVALGTVAAIATYGVETRRSRR